MPDGGHFTFCEWRWTYVCVHVYMQCMYNVHTHSMYWGMYAWGIVFSDQKHLKNANFLGDKVHQLSYTQATISPAVSLISISSKVDPHICTWDDGPYPPSKTNRLLPRGGHLETSKNLSHYGTPQGWVIRIKALFVLPWTFNHTAKCNFQCMHNTL